MHLPREAKPALQGCGRSSLGAGTSAPPRPPNQEGHVATSPRAASLPSQLPGQPCRPSLGRGRSGPGTAAQCPASRPQSAGAPLLASGLEAARPLRFVTAAAPGPWSPPGREEARPSPAGSMRRLRSGAAPPAPARTHPSSARHPGTPPQGRHWLRVTGLAGRPCLPPLGLMRFIRCLLRAPRGQGCGLSLLSQRW